MPTYSAYADADWTWSDAMPQSVQEFGVLLSDIEWSQPAKKIANRVMSKHFDDQPPPLGREHIYCQIFLALYLIGNSIDQLQQYIAAQKSDNPPPFPELVNERTVLKSLDTKWDGDDENFRTLARKTVRDTWRRIESKWRVREDGKACASVKGVVDNFQDCWKHHLDANDALLPGSGDDGSATPRELVTRGSIGRVNVGGGNVSGGSVGGDSGYAGTRVQEVVKRNILENLANTSASAPPPPATSTFPPAPSPATGARVQPWSVTWLPLLKEISLALLCTPYPPLAKGPARRGCRTLRSDREGPAVEEPDALLVASVTNSVNQTRPSGRRSDGSISSVVHALYNRVHGLAARAVPP